MNNTLALKGTFLYSISPEEMRSEDGYLIIKEGVSQGIFSSIPGDYKDIQFLDYSGHLIVPGMVDIHLHGPQYGFMGSGMDLELLDWLNTYTFPEEARYGEIAYAKEHYQEFVKELKESFTTRACIYGTVHKEANLHLMDLLEESGLVTYVGKVNMDRNCPDYLVEQDAETSLKETREWLDYSMEHFTHTFPMLTPRFIPTCSDVLLQGLGDLKQEYKVPYQSHLAENPSEIQWVSELCPDADSYTDAYGRRNAYGKESHTIMAHCVYLTEAEEDALKAEQVFIAHCPDSNVNLASGIAPARRYLRKGIPMGLGSDIGAGSTLNMLGILKSAIQMSKLYWRLVDEKDAPLTLSEAFYLATLGGGAVFGKVGSFLPGYEVDAVVLKDTKKNDVELEPLHRLEKIVYTGDYSNMVAKFVQGRKIV